ncbi:MAG: hypothetical protein ACI8UO_000274 [Verrucomicrobiales bacterium]|jgi:hypothetical protein
MKTSLIAVLTGAVLALSVNQAAAEDPKVLYVTHEPGTYHKYTPQMAVFKEIGEKAGWDVTFMTGEHEAQIEKLRAPDYAKGYDAVVYNFCFAKSTDLDAASNLMDQTRVNGVPAMLIHCSMHSWWPTYKTGGKDYSKGAQPDPLVASKWKKANPDKPLPIWGDFTGVASVRHGKKLPIALSRSGDHAVTAGLPEGFSTPNTELYNNIYVGDDVVPLVTGAQEGEKDAIVMWTVPRGKSRLIGLTWGHDVADWTTKPFQSLVTDGVNDLIAKPGADGAE